KNLLKVAFASDGRSVDFRDHVIFLKAGPSTRSIPDHMGDDHAIQGLESHFFRQFWSDVYNFYPWNGFLYLSILNQVISNFGSDIHWHGKAIAGIRSRSRKDSCIDSNQFSTDIN